jgi:L-malate glycosyltransferase
MHLILKLAFAGLEGGVLKLANGFNRRVIQPSVCSCWPADLVKQHLRADVPLFEMDRRRSGNDPVFVFKLAALLRRERPDVLHSHSWGTLVEGVVAARLAGIPHVVHGEHGTLQMRKVPLQRFLWSRVDRLLSVSERLSDKMASAMGIDRGLIHTIHNGVDTVRFHPDRREPGRLALGLTAADTVVGTVGRLEPVKDQASFIEAVAELARRGLPLKVLIAGDGVLKGALQARTRALGLTDRVAFLGNRLDVEAVTAALDVFVLSSVSEGLSNTILEAMASGVPIVATDVGGAAELVVEGRTGVLVPPSDVPALAGAMARLINEPDRRLAMGRAARERAESVFGLDRMIENYQALYTGLVAPRR